MHPVKSRSTKSTIRQPYCTDAGEHCWGYRGVDSRVCASMFSPGCWPPRRADEMRQSGWRVFSFHRRHGAFSPLFFIVPTHPIFLYDTHTPQNALYNVCLYSHVIDKHLFIDGRPFGTRQYCVYSYSVDIVHQRNCTQHQEHRGNILS